MNQALAHAEARPSGAAMDQPLQRRHLRRAVVACLASAVILAGAAALWQLNPRGLQVPLANARIATVEHGLFRDEVALRASAAPLHTVMLDAVESGRVEEVLAHDGGAVAEGEVLFRLSNPQRHLELLARESEHAQQISNYTNMRMAAEASQAERERRLSDLTYALALAEKKHQRNASLAGHGFVSGSALEDSADQLAQQRRALDTERSSDAAASTIQRDALQQMRQAIMRLEAGLQLVHANLAALVVRAPVAGRLTDFHLQRGETVRLDQHLGRIDDLARYKLSAQVDEYYLNRIATGQPATTVIEGRSHALTVSRIYPQIKDGRFTLELTFEREQATALHPGQSTETAITLGGARAGLLLPNDAFVNDGGGQWLYVLEDQGKLARQRTVRLGRRSQSQVEVLSGLQAGERVLVSSYTSYGNRPLLQLTQ